jgi:DNA mismatch repair protein MutS2
MNLFLEDIKKTDKTNRRLALQKLREEEVALARKLREVKGQREEGPAIESLHEGDRIFIRSLGCDAEVLAVLLKQSRIKVKAEGREIEVPLSDVGYKEGKSGLHQKASSSTFGFHESAPSRINLIGQRVDDALSLIEPFLNHASLDGLPEVTIVHGIGTGILARAVRDFLKGHPLVKGFRKGDRSEGGEGVTIARLE